MKEASVATYDASEAVGLATSKCIERVGGGGYPEDCPVKNTSERRRLVQSVKEQPVSSWTPLPSTSVWNVNGSRPGACPGVASVTFYPTVPAGRQGAWRCRVWLRPQSGASGFARCLSSFQSA